MQPRWWRVKEIFSEALDLPAEGRGIFVRHACGDDAGLREEVEALLASDGRGAALLEAPLDLGWLLEPEDDRPHLGEHIGPYVIEEELGRGGMGIVYRASRDDGELRRTVAVKVICRCATDPGTLARFRRERQILVDTAHPNVAALLDAGTTADGRPYFIMEFVDGVPIDRYCDLHRLSISERVSLFLQLCSAVELSHQHGVIHRDIKPGNVLVTEDGVPKLLDFGIARFIHGQPPEATMGSDGPGPTGEASAVYGVMSRVAGTPLYASPEQLAGAPPSPAMDIYSLGVLLYVLLCGRYPRDPGTVYSAARRALHPGRREPSPPSERVAEDADGGAAASDDPLSGLELARARCGTVASLRSELQGGLDRIAGRALRTRPSERDATVRELRTALQSWLRQREAEQTGPPARPAGEPLLRARPALAAAAAATILLISALALSPNGSGSGLVPVRYVGRLTSVPGMELDPAISPDGAHLAYAAGACGTTRILVQDLEGDGSPTVEPVVLTGGLDGGHRRPRWSPDGRGLAFEAWTDDHSDLYWVPFTGGAPTRLGGPNIIAGRRSPAWSPDGGTLAYARADGIYLLDLEGGSETRLSSLTGASHLRWSSTGEALVAVTVEDPEQVTALLGHARHTSIWWVRVRDGRIRRLTEHAWEDAAPMWARGDSEIWFVSDRGGTRDLYSLRVTDGADGPAGAPERLTMALRAAEIDVEREGRRIVYAVPHSERDVHVVPILPIGELTMDDAVQVTRGATYGVGVDVAPDGSWLVYDSDVRGRHAVIRHSLPEGFTRVLAADPSLDLLPAISPDGEWVAFYSLRSETPALFVTDKVGSYLLQVSRRALDATCLDGDCLLPLHESVLPAGRWISAPEAGDALAAGAFFPLTLRRSPDGRRVAVVVEGRVEIRESGRRSRVVDLPGSRALSVAWDPDGEALYAAAADGRHRLEIWTVSGEGIPRRLVRGDASVAAHPTAVASDGSHVYFRMPRCEADLWLLETS